MERQLFRTGPHGEHVIHELASEGHDTGERLIAIRDSKGHPVHFTELELDSLALKWLASRVRRIEHDLMGYSISFEEAQQEARTQGDTL